MFVSVDCLSKTTRQVQNAKPAQRRQPCTGKSQNGSPEQPRRYASRPTNATPLPPRPPPMTAVIDINDVRRSRERGASCPARKFAVVQRVMLDPNVSHLDFRVFYYVADATDSETEL